MNCDCSRLGANAPLTTTVTAFPCGDVWATAQKNPTLVNRVHYQLCTATHKAGQLFLDTGHWVWGKLSLLWSDFKSALKNIAAVAGRILRGALQLLQKILTEVQRLIQWLDDQAKHVLDYLMWTAIGVGAFLLVYRYMEKPPVIVQGKTA